MVGLSDVLRSQGNLLEAKKLLEQALPETQKTGDKALAAIAISRLGDIALAQDDLGSARSSYEESIKTLTEVDAKRFASESRLALARLALEEGRTTDALDLARQCIKEFQGQKISDDEASSHAVLAPGLLAKGNSAQEAEREIATAKVLVAKSQDRSKHFEVSLAAARVQAQLGNPAEAQRNLEAVLGEATRLGFITYQFEAALELGKLEMQTGKTAAARARLAALQKDAGSKGFQLIASKAAKAQI